MAGSTQAISCNQCIVEDCDRPTVDNGYQACMVRETANYSNEQILISVH